MNPGEREHQDATIYELKMPAAVCSLFGWEAVIELVDHSVEKLLVPP